MLMPKKVKFRKQQKGKRRGKAWRGSSDYVAAHQIGIRYAKFNIVAVSGVNQ